MSDPRISLVKDKKSPPMSAVEGIRLAWSVCLLVSIVMAAKK